MSGVVVATWNVHGFVGRDRARDPARCFEEIRRIDADLVALQEVTGSDWEPLAADAGYRVVLGHTRPLPFGNALLVRLPLVRLQRVDLSVSGHEPRGALDAVVSLCEGASRTERHLRVVATHLGLRARERRRQADRLARHIEERDADLPIVLVGDLNDWTPWGGQLRRLGLSVGPLSRIPTFPSRRPLFALDRVAWCAPRFASQLRLVRSQAVRRASDHLPLRLELESADAPPASAGMAHARP